MAKDDIFQVTTTFVITFDDGRDVEYHVGELVDGDDPALKRVPEHFGPPIFKHRKPAPEPAAVEKKAR